jgi:phenylalanyl-tRNA synthetase alpha chain
MIDAETMLDRIAAADSLGELEGLRVSALGKSGSITALLKSLGAMDAETRATEAPKIHALREQVTEAIAGRKAALEAADLERKLATEKIDLSLPAPESASGTVHPVSQVMDELAEIFADLGFAVAEGPEIETQWYNFTALNMPENHPARAMQDTFYLEPREGEDEPRVLRTHTSPVQIRAGEKGGAPIYVIAPGRVYRCDSVAPHTPLFHQVEGFVIDKGITVGHL